MQPLRINKYDQLESAGADSLEMTGYVFQRCLPLAIDYSHKPFFYALKHAHFS